MPWIEFQTEQQRAGVHTAYVPNPEDKPVKAVREFIWGTAIKTSLMATEVGYGQAAVTLMFDREIHGEVAL